MPERSIGIDIGDGALRAVCIVRSMRGGWRIDAAEEISIDAEGSVSEAIRQLKEKMDLQGAAIALSLPAEQVSFHNVKLPFREAKKIEQTIAFELETLLPHGIDEYLLDYTITNRSQYTDVLAAVVPRSVIREKVALIGEETPGVRVLTISAVAVAARLLTNKSPAGPVLLLDIGARETVAVCIFQGKIIQVRRYAFDADHATLCHELASTLEYLGWKGILEERIARIVFTGNGSSAGTISTDVADFFSLPVESLDIAQTEDFAFSDGLREMWQPARMNQALALAAYIPKRGQGFNFPLIERQSKARQEQLAGALKWGAAFASVALGLVAVDNYLDYRYMKLRLENLKKEITLVFRSAAPEVTRIVDPVQQFRVKIAETKKITAGIGGGDESATVLDVLKDISALAPPTTEFLMTGFTLEEDRLLIKGTAKNFDAVDTLKKELAKSRYLKSVQIGTTSLMKQGDKVEFDLRITAKR